MFTLTKRKEKEIERVNRLVDEFHQLYYEFPYEDLIFQGGYFWYPKDDFRTAYIRCLSEKVEQSLYGIHGRCVWNMLNVHKIMLYGNDEIASMVESSTYRAVMFNKR